MSNYICEQSAGDILSNTFQIYAQNFRVLFVITILPVIPLSIIELILLMADELGQHARVISAIAEFMILTFVTAPITVAVSDYCLKNKPGVRRSYKRLATVFWKFLGTFLLVTLIELIGFLLLLIPGVIISIFLIFSMTLVPLERRGGVDALKRSMALGKGHRWRILGVFVIAYLILFTGATAIGILWGFIGGFLLPESEVGIYFLSEVGSYIGMVVGPIGVIPIVLLYYDMRVRKENYDNAALAQDMMG